MNEKKQGVIFLVIDLAVYAAILCWLYLPLFLPFQLFKIELIKITRGTGDFFAIIGGGDNWFFLLSYLLYAFPAIFLYKLVSIFLRNVRPVFFSSFHYFSFIINFIFSNLLLVFFVCIFLNKASHLSYFLTLDVYTDVFTVMLLVFSIIQPINAINKLRHISKSYRRYVEMSQSAVVGRDQASFRMVRIRMGILPKLLIAFILAVVIIIASLSWLLSGDFKSTIVESVIATGTMLADQSGSYIKDNLKKEKLFFIKSYLKKEAKKNENASLAFESLSWYDKSTNTGDFYVKLSTDDGLTNKALKEDYASIEEPCYMVDARTKTYDIISPITVGTKKIGYSVVQYRQDEIFKSFYKSQIRVLLFSVLVIYLAVILVYIIGSNIVFPILFLQINVKKIGTTLSDMIRGTERIQASSLHYEDMIRSKDEIRTLSSEINNMVTVIKGIIPYISASTLKHSDREGTTSMIKDLTFLFTDIRGFTTMSEGRTPDEVVQILNFYLDLQTQIILANQGDIDKFVGDEVMAVFDGPDKEMNACNACMEIIRAMSDDREKRIASKEHYVEIGIGLNSGSAVFGSMGAKERMDFTCIGDNVNIAARLEGANKEYKTKSLVTDSIFGKVSSAFLCREIDYMTVKGKSEPIRIYEVLQEKSKAGKRVAELADAFAKGLKLYRARKWDEAMAVFKKNMETYKDGASEVFFNRCGFFKKNQPPADWDGVYRLTTK